MSKKTKIRLLSGACGAAIVLTALVLQDQFALHEAEVQIAVWSLLVLAMVLLVNRNHFRERWFWWSIMVAGLLHVGNVCVFKSRLPFPSMGVAILMSGFEAIVLQMVVMVCQRMAERRGNM
jgi:hypothetical protein